MTSRGYFSSLTKEQEDNALLNKLAVNESSYNRLTSSLNRLVQSSEPADLFTSFLFTKADCDRATIQSELEEEFVNFELAMIKAQNIRNVNGKEVQRYNAEKQSIRIPRLQRELID